MVVGCLNIVFLVVAMRLFATYHNYLICIEYIRDILNGNTIITSFSYTPPDTHCIIFIKK